MPAPAVIPTPQAYTNVAVVKTFVVNISAHSYWSGQDTVFLGGNPWKYGTAPHGAVSWSLRRINAAFGWYRG